ERQNASRRNHSSTSGYLSTGTDSSTRVLTLSQWDRSGGPTLIKSSLCNYTQLMKSGRNQLLHLGQWFTSPKPREDLRTSTTTWLKWLPELLTSSPTWSPLVNVSARVLTSPEGSVSDLARHVHVWVGEFLRGSGDLGFPSVSTTGS